MEESKKCSKCQRELPVSMFRWKNKSLGKLHSQCKDCEKQSEKLRYAESKNRQEKDLQTTLLQKEKNLFIVNKAKERGCQKCGEKRPYLMEFHHRNPDEKANTIAHMIKSSSQEKLILELNKCIVLCANCHREFHFFEKEYSITLEEYLGK